MDVRHLVVHEVCQHSRHVDVVGTVLFENAVVELPQQRITVLDPLQILLLQAVFTEEVDSASGTRDLLSTVLPSSALQRPTHFLDAVWKRGRDR